MKRNIRPWPLKVSKSDKKPMGSKDPGTNFGYVSHLFHCNKCEKTFSTKISLRKHVFKIHESQNKEFACKLCNKTFVYEATLKVHLKAHRGIYPYTCEFCGKGFTSKQNMTGHVASVHTGQMLFHCTFCNMGFNYKSNLKMHMEKVHPGQTSAVPIQL